MTNNRSLAFLALLNFFFYWTRIAGLFRERVERPDAGSQSMTRGARPGAKPSF